ncbi:MAG: S9 family peptidase, partial [Nannocystaceae bacterium]|nr:S9 family peptidase [Nannocystaceae bacterium]
MRAHLLLALSLAACSSPEVAPESQSKEVVASVELWSTSRPETPRGSAVDRLHGVDVADPYRWLEVMDGPTQAWTGAQDAFARDWLAKLPGRDALRTALRPLLEVESRSAPVERGELWFFSRRRPGEDKARHFVSDIGGGNERVLIDPAVFGAAVTVRQVMPSPGGRYVTYLRATNASDEATLMLRDVASGQDVDAPIEGARYAAPSWMPDESAFYYTGLSTDPDIPAPQRPGTASVRRHVIGTAPQFDERIYGPLGDNQSFLWGEVSPQGRWLVISRFREFSRTQIHVADLAAKTRTFVPVNPGVSERASAMVLGDRLLLHTNRDAPRFRVLELDLHNLAAPWKEVVAQGEGTLEGVHVSSDALTLQWLDKAHSRLEVRDLDGSHPRSLELPGRGSVGAIIGSSAQDDAFLYYSSFADSPQLHHIRPATGERSLFWKQRTPIDTDRIEVDQVWVDSPDGTSVSMFIVHRDDTPLDGDRPTLLTGYGGFGVSLTPQFSPIAALWVEHGGVFAVPNLRGGGEYGESWHEAGRGPNKQNVF